MPFAHLHVHSHYSLLQALPKIPDLVKYAKKLDMKALALTDSGNLYGAIEFYKECQKKEIKPILGVDFYVAARTRHDKEGRIDSKRTRFVLLAKNVAGYQNLIKLVTRSNFEGFYYKPRIDQELIKEHSGGLIAISPSFSGDIAMALKNSDEEKALGLLKNYKDIYGDDFYLEISHHPEIEGHEENMIKLITFAKKHETKLVAAHDVYYLDPEDKKARETLVSIQNEYTEKTYGEDPSDWSFINQDRADELFKDIPEALANIDEIVEKINLELPLGKWLFPKFIVEDGLSYDDELRKIVFEGIIRRKLSETPELLARVNYELDVIKTKGYAPYFLVVGDLLKFAHSNGILTTIRGSVAGSMVTYLAHITNVNPLEYKLPFERFLNPERPSAPDIDMDYADNRRDEMISYARAKYGQDKVAQIGTFGTMMARGAVRDVTRALGFEYSLGDTIAKLIPMGSQGFPMTLSHALEITPDLQKMYDNNNDTKTIIDMAIKIEGCARHISVHAAGVVISPIPLNEIVPVQFDPKGEGKVITQYDMHSVDENNAGLLKFDFLGIRNLAILADAVKIVKKIKNIDVDIENVPVDDQKTFEMLARGETIGLFQLNGTGMTKYLIDLKPSSIHDINAMVALYRPGPMESIPEYIERKHNPSKVRFLDPRMKDILDQSYGVITYQDDVMMIAIKLGGYSWLEADKLRKAMGKKIPKEMAEQKEKLKEGLIVNGMTDKKVKELWELIEPFAAYGFNKAHAASYGKVAYQTAYMKANFPAIYMSAVLTAESGDVEEIGSIIQECKRMNIPVLPPDVNESFKGFTVVKDDEGNDNIRFGLYTIKNFGENIAEVLIEEREKNGKFKSLEDFLKRIKNKNLNKKSLEALIKVGAFDEFEERGKLLANTEDLLAYHKEETKADINQDSLFGAAGIEISHLRLTDAPPLTEEARLNFEKELLGLYISGHPLDKFAEQFAKQNTSITKIREDFLERRRIFEEQIADPTLSKQKLKDIKARKKLDDDKDVVMAGIITEAKEIITKTNTRMMFLTLGDKTAQIECVVFSRTYETAKEMLVPDICVAFKGKVNERNGEISFIVDKVKKL